MFSLLVDMSKVFAQPLAMKQRDVFLRCQQMVGQGRLLFNVH